MSERTHGFVAGVILGFLIALMVIAAIACASSYARTTPGGWSIMQPGTTLIQTPCGIVAIEVRANTEHTVFYWRVIVIPKTVPIPPKEKPGAPTA
jgi:hypothetical protein